MLKGNYPGGNCQGDGDNCRGGNVGIPDAILSTLTLCVIRYLKRFVLFFLVTVFSTCK